MHLRLYTQLPLYNVGTLLCGYISDLQHNVSQTDIYPYLLFLAGTTMSLSLSTGVNSYSPLSFRPHIHQTYNFELLYFPFYFPLGPLLFILLATLLISSLDYPLR